jgi:hypothetical protein
VGQRHLAWHGHLAAADHSGIGDAVARGLTGAGGDDGGAGAGEATRWMCVVSRASGRGISGKMVVSWDASSLVKIPRDRVRHNFLCRMTA